MYYKKWVGDLGMGNGGSLVLEELDLDDFFFFFFLLRRRALDFDAETL